jgi:broad specificity phosphatase PhoE
MGAIMTRYLYLTRHGEATPDESGLTENGRRQAALLGERLRDVPLSAVHHGPLPVRRLNHGNAALTVIRYAPDRPASVLSFNDMAHLPAELRWTGFPPELRA